MFDYSKEELWSLYKQIPKDLQRATFSEQVGKNIKKACNDSGISDESLILNITKDVGYVFLGLLSPSKFSNELQKDLKMKKELVSQVSARLINDIFLPLKKDLDALYEIEIKKVRVPKPKVKPVEKKKPIKDIYREKI